MIGFSGLPHADMLFLRCCVELEGSIVANMCQQASKMDLIATFGTSEQSVSSRLSR